MVSSHALIVAPATAAGAGARAIVRLAGDGLDGLLPRLFTATAPGFAAPGVTPRVVAARLADDGLGREWAAVPVEVLHWPGPAGPIGGPLAEVQLPCSAPLVDAVVAEACRHGARLARGGEFTLRAFLAGRLDLVQAEAVLAVVDARTPEELVAALDRMAGGAGGVLHRSRSTLLDLLADIEAAIDFADETTPDAVPVADAASRRRLAERLASERDAVAAVDRHLRSRGGGSGDLPLVVLVGRPNIGKSSLFNALVGRDAALVADAPGTTRDWLEAPLAAGCRLVDLAGVPEAEAEDAVDAAAVAAARELVARADVLVVCRDAAAPGRPIPALPAGPRVDVLTRCDRAGAAGAAVGIRTSVVTGIGVDELRGAIAAAVALVPPRGSPATVRLAAGVAAARAALDAALPDVLAASAGGAVDEAVVAGHVRRAVDALAEVTGAATDADLLDRIFSRHCIGK